MISIHGEQSAQQKSAWAAIDERKRLKSRGRIATMKAKMADREAARSGMVWDVRAAKWVRP